MLIKFNEIPEERVYDEYLRSNAWINIRNQVLERDKHKCKICGATENLRVHHKDYECIYHEEDALYDLVTLCDDCHRELHEFLKNEVSEKTKNALYKLREDYYIKFKEDIINTIVENMGIPLLEKSKKHALICTYLSSFWGINVKLTPIYASFAGQNAYCEMKKRGLIK